MHLEDQTNHRLLKSRSVFSSRCATKGLLADKLENLYSRIAFIEVLLSILALAKCQGGIKVEMTRIRINQLPVAKTVALK